MAFDTFWTRAAQQPEHVALIDANGRGIPAGGLLASANQLVHGLRSLGLRTGDVVAAVLPNCPASYEIVLAVQQAAGTWCRSTFTWSARRSRTSSRTARPAS